MVIDHIKLVFGIMLYDDGPEVLSTCLEHLRNVYPNQPVFLINDGYELYNSAYEKLAARHHCDYVMGNRLKSIEKGCIWWHRFFEKVSEYQA